MPGFLLYKTIIMPYKTISAEAELFVKHKDVSVYHTYCDDDLSNEVNLYHYVLNADLCNDESFDVRELNCWSEFKDRPGNSSGKGYLKYQDEMYEHIKNVIIKAIDNGELKPYKPLE